MLIALFHVAGAGAALAVGLLFLAAAIGKLRHRALLPAVVANYRLLPRPLVAPVAASLPWVEAALGLMLVVDQRGGAVAAAATATLLLLFAAAMAVNLRRGRTHIDCGCGFGMRQPLHRALVWRNVLLAAMLLPRIVAERAPTLQERAVATPAALAALLLLIFLNAFLTMPQSRPSAA